MSNDGQVYDESPTLGDCFGFFGEIYIRQHGNMVVGETHEGKPHNRDHITLVVSGSVLVKWRNKAGQSGEKRFKGPTFFIVKAECWHDIIAEEEGTNFFCVFAVPAGSEDCTPFISEANDPYV